MLHVTCKTMYRKLLFLAIIIVGIFFAIAVFAQTCDPDPGCATCPPHIYQGINCGANWYCGGCTTSCFDCPRAGDPTGATVLNYVSCTCQCPPGKIVCSGACVTAPTCPTPTREQDNSSCSGCGACKAGYSPDPLNPNPPNPCLKTAYMDYWNTGDFKITGASPGGDLYMASGKAIRIDAAGNAVLNVGNWGGGGRIDLNLLSSGGGLNLQNGFLTGAYIAQSPWATNALGSKNAFGLQINRLLGATTGRYTVTTSGFSGGSPQLLFDGFYDSSMIIPYGGTGVVEVDFNPQLGWTPNTNSGFVYMDGMMVINFYYTLVPTNVKVEMYRYSGGADGWQTIYDTTTNNKNPLIIPTNPVFNYIKKIRVTFSGGGDPTYGIRVAEIEWFPTRESSADQLTNIPKYYWQNVDISMPELRMRSSSNWSNITAKITNSGDVMGTRLCIGTDCRSAWPEAVNAFVQNGNSFGALAILGTNDNFPLAFETNNVERMRIDTTGNVTIGGKNICLADGTNCSGFGNYIWNTTTQQPSSNFNISGRGVIGDRLSVGTTNTTYNLMVAGSSPRIYLLPTAGTNPELDFGSPAMDTHWAIYRDTASDQLRFWRNDNRMVITSDGQVGIGTTTVSNKLTVSGNLSVGSGYVTGAPTDGAIIQGNVGIGTNSPSSTAKLHVVNSAGRGIFADASTFGGEFQGGERGIGGYATGAVPADYGGYFYASGSSGTGVYGSGPAYGGYFEATGAADSAGVFSLVYGSGSTGIFGYATGAGSTAVAGMSTATTGSNYGGQFSSGGGGIITDAQNNFGVWGAAQRAPNRNFGGLFTVGDTFVDVRIPGTVSIGVAGLAADTAGTEYGGYFRVDSANGYGVYGVSNNANSWAGYFTGGKGVFTPQLCLGTESNCRTDWPAGLSNGTIADSTLRWDGSNWVENTSFRVNASGQVIVGAWQGSTISVTYGGTGLTSTPTNGQLLIGNGAGYTLANLTGTANQIIVTNGVGSITLSTPQDIATTSSPTFASLTLGSPLPVSSGGTGSSSFNAGSVIFSDGTKLTQDNANFFWDNTNKRLGIGKNTPAYALDVVGDVNVANNLRIGTGLFTGDDYIYFDDGATYIRWYDAAGEFRFTHPIFSDGWLSGNQLTVRSGGYIQAVDTSNTKSTSMRHMGTYGILETQSANPGTNAGYLVLRGDVDYPANYVEVQDELRVTSSLTVNGGATVSGNLGIGTASPTSKLYIYGTGGASTLQTIYSTTDAESSVSMSTPYHTWRVGQNFSGYRDNFVIYDQNAGAARLVIDTSGNTSISGGTNIVYRCTTAGTLPVGALTINSANCGASTDTGLRVK